MERQWSVQTGPAAQCDHAAATTRTKRTSSATHVRVGALCAVRRTLRATRVGAGQAPEGVLGSRQQESARGAEGGGLGAAHPASVGPIGPIGPMATKAAPFFLLPIKNIFWRILPAAKSDFGLAGGPHSTN